MKHLLIAILSSLFIANTSYADLAGEWNGWGEWLFDGSGASCTHMKLVFEKNDDTFVRKGGYFDCQVVALETYPMTWQWDGKNLFYDNQPVGSYDGTHFELKEDYSDTVYIMTQITVDGLHLDYQEIWYQKESDAIIYEIYGRLFKKEK